MNTDLQKFITGIVTMSFFGAYTLAGKGVDTLNNILAKIKAAINGLSAAEATPPNEGQVVLAIFKALRAITQLWPNVTLTDLENIAYEIYTGLTGGAPLNFAQIWSDVQNLIAHKLDTDLPAPSADPVDDLVSALSTLTAFGLAQVKSADATTDINAVITGLSTGIGAINPATPPTQQEAVTGLFDVLDSISDWVNRSSFTTVKNVLEKLFTIITGNASGFLKFWQGLVQAGKLTKALKEEKAA